MNKSIFSLLAFFLLLTFSIYGQYDSRGKEFNYLDAEAFYNSGNYYDALALFQVLSDENPKVVEYQLKIGVCHTHLTTEPGKAIEYLEKVYDKKPKTPQINYHLAKAYALNYKFDKAIEFFEKELAVKGVLPDIVNEIPLLIQQCKNAKELIKDTVQVEIVNLGETVNSINNEYSPTISADESTLIYTYKGVNSVGGRQDEFNREFVNGNFYEDIYVAKRSGDSWEKPTSISDSINSNLHEASISLSPDGQRLLIYKDTKESSGDIFESKKVDGEWSEPLPLSINSTDWEGHAAISPKGDYIIFSSDRVGGIGGRDLYIAVWKDSVWGDIRNMGPTINTAYDDDAPFIHSDGVTFSFSSEGHSSMGGYDIFESVILTDSTYSDPRNLGYPINTTANDIFFYVSGKGNAYYSSAQSGGYGQQDIYVINVKEVVTSKPVILVKGVIRTNKKFDAAKITVRTESGENLGVYYSDLTDGKYQFYVDVNDYYVITYEVEGFTAQVESVDATQFTQYAEVEKDINFVSTDISIEGYALYEKLPYSPIINLTVYLKNKDGSIIRTDTTDANGRYLFENLPNEEHYLIYLEEKDEKLISDSSYIFKGKVMLKGLPYSEASINDLEVDDEGNFSMEVRKKFYDILSSDTDLKLDEMPLDDLIAKFGDIGHPGLVFRVQVGAYVRISKFDGSHLKGLGEFDKIKLADGITRFSLGEFPTLRSTRDLLAKVIGRGQKDAFIAIYLDDKRVSFKDLRKSGIMK